MIRRPPRSTQSRSSAASDVYKRQIITGAAQGFGAGIANLMFSEGANVIIADLNEEKGKKFAAELNSKGTKNKASFISVNVSKVESVKNLVQQTVIQFGGLDVM